MDERKPLLLEALNRLYPVSDEAAGKTDPSVPWLNAPEDSWL